MIDRKMILWYTSTHMKSDEFPIHTRSAALYSLAVVGFVSLIALGIMLAIYSARFVPTTVGSLGSAVVSLSQIFTPSPTTSLSVVPTATTTIFFGDEVVPASVVPTPTISVPKNTTPVRPNRGTPSSITIPMGSTTRVALTGLPDLSVHIDRIGFMSATTTDSFVATSTIPTGARPAVAFTIKNTGTNGAGPWRFSAVIPTETSYIYQSPLQQPLNPGDSIQYTLSFDQATKGANKMVSVTANFDHAVAESNFNNNSASANVTIVGN